MCANIPLNKIMNTEFRSFLEKYTLKDIPCESTLRKTYLNECYEETIDKIRKHVVGNKIWVSIDESTDVEGRFIANVIVGTLLVDEPGDIFLLTSEVLDKVNFSTIAKLFDASMFTLWPDGIRHDDVLLFVSDAAPYMKKAGTAIKALYSKMIHVTCLAHGMHRIAEEIRSHFPKVDKLISRVKQVFLKAPSRTILFKTEAPGIPLPPEPILTRWGTWLQAASYYCQYFKEINKVLQLLDSSDAVSIREAKDIVSDRSVEMNLTFIHVNYGFLPTTITQLEKQKLPLHESIATVKSVENKLEHIIDEAGTAIKEKLKNVLEKNCGFNDLKKISSILTGEATSMEGLPEDLNGNDLAHFKYAPITSSDIERSFSRYKNVLTDNRRSFEIENIKKALVIQCNTFTD
ncbi:uncharacterized protein LOC112601985 [Melanaphis sacchari]|uniref:uncharacterized protein LOC112601985 n=2 Tax=Melanaphis sacchari TaxID=742174 RepID=UPI000DC14CA6|nr:uncharacterized protein LOC112601985 [Melanaphis sacchari]